MQLILEGWEDGEAVSATLHALDRSQVQAAERVTLDLGRGAAVTVQQKPGGLSKAPLGVGAAVWDSSLVLAAWLASLPPDALTGKRVIELGAGVGLAGLVAARLGAQVVMTDRRPLLSLLRGNAARNWLAGSPDPRAATAGASTPPPGKAEVAALDWDAADRMAVTARLAHPPPDYILAADCIYIDPGGQTPNPAKFAATAAELAAEHTQLIIAHEVRPQDLREDFAAACRAFFGEMQVLPLDGLPQGFKGPHVELYRVLL